MPHEPIDDDTRDIRLAKASVTALSLPFLIVALYAMLFVGSCATLMAYEDGSTGGPPMDLIESIAYFIYRYVLSFPLAISNWFSEADLSSTLFYVFPNAVIIGAVLGVIVWMRAAKASREEAPKDDPRDNPYGKRAA